MEKTKKRKEKNERKKTSTQTNYKKNKQTPPPPHRRKKERKNFRSFNISSGRQGIPVAIFPLIFVSGYSESYISTICFASVFSEQATRQSSSLIAVEISKMALKLRHGLPY